MIHFHQILSAEKNEKHLFCLSISISYLYPENPTFGTWKSIKQPAKQTLRFRFNCLKFPSFLCLLFDTYFSKDSHLRKPPGPMWKTRWENLHFHLTSQWVFCCISWMGMQHGNGGELQKTINWLPSSKLGLPKTPPTKVWEVYPNSADRSFGWIFSTKQPLHVFHEGPRRPITLALYSSVDA